MQPLHNTHSSQHSTTQALHYLSRGRGDAHGADVAVEEVHDERERAVQRAHVLLLAWQGRWAGGNNGRWAGGQTEWGQRRDRGEERVRH